MDRGLSLNMVNNKQNLVHQDMINKDVDGREYILVNSWSFDKDKQAYVRNEVIKRYLEPLAE